MSKGTTEPARHSARRVGRPPRIDRDRIARAVVDIGFEEVTTKRVAEHLGMSVAGLYYYVRGRDDLLMLGSEYSLSRAKLPEDRGQHWAQWLREWARHTRGSMAEYELMEHYISGTFNIERMVEVGGRALDVLCRHGFDRDEAQMIWGSVSGIALGSAVEELRWREVVKITRAEESPEQRDSRRAHRSPEERAILRTLVDADADADRDESFEERMTTLLVGIAVRCGRPLDDEVMGAS